MPSVFEPGGIVQHEFFVGGTPVIAHKTGGLKDSVIEFEWINETGSGFTFECHKAEDLIFAIQRAIGTFANKEKYQKLRENAFRATMPGEQVCKAWLQEFHRLRGKVYFDFKVMIDAQTQFGHWDPSKYEPVNIFEEIIGKEKEAQYQFDDTDLGAAESQIGQKFAGKQVESEFDKIQRERVPFNFMFHNRGPRHQMVQLCGTFDNWEKRHAMTFDHITNQWFITLHLPKGGYSYKYVVNNKDWVVNDEERKEKDKAGNLNNFCLIE